MYKLFHPLLFRHHYLICRGHFCAFTASKAMLAPKYHRHFIPRSYSRACYHLFYLNISPLVTYPAQQRGELLFQGSPCPSFSRSLLPPPPRSWSHIPVAAATHLSRGLSLSLYRVPATPCRSTLLYGRYFTLGQRLPLPSSKEGNESETVRHCRQCRLSALAILILQLFFLFVCLSLSLFLPLTASPFLALLPYRSTCAMSLFSFPSLSLPIPSSLSLSLAPFRYTRQPYFPLWLTRSRLLSFLPPRGCHPPSTLLIFPPLSLKLKSIVAPRARGLCRKHCYPHQLLPTQTPKGIFLWR